MRSFFHRFIDDKKKKLHLQKKNRLASPAMRKCGFQNVGMDILREKWRRRKQLSLFSSLKKNPTTSNQLCRLEAAREPVFQNPAGHIHLLVD